MGVRGWQAGAQVGSRQYTGMEATRDGGERSRKNRARNCANDITGLGREEDKEKGAAMTQQGDRNLSGVHVSGKVDL